MCISSQIVLRAGDPGRRRCHHLPLFGSLTLENIVITRLLPSKNVKTKSQEVARS